MLFFCHFNSPSKRFYELVILLFGTKIRPFHATKPWRLHTGLASTFRRPDRSHELVFVGLRNSKQNLQNGQIFPSAWEICGAESENMWVETSIWPSSCSNTINCKFPAVLTTMISLENAVKLTFISCQAVCFCVCVPFSASTYPPWTSKCTFPSSLHHLETNTRLNPN